MAAATHVVGSTHSSSSSSSVSPPPAWHPVVLVLYDLDLGGTPSPSPTTPAATATASPPRCHNNHLRPWGASGKPRRPRPSRKLPTTYISADAASFRRMVHQVTGADDVVLHLATEELFCRPPAPPPSHASLTLPTLDTSAFLLGADARRQGQGGDSGRAARPPGASCCHGSASLVVVVDTGAGAVVQMEARAGGGFRSLESVHA